MAIPLFRQLEQMRHPIDGSTTQSRRHSASTEVFAQFRAVGCFSSAATTSAAARFHDWFA